MSSIKWTHNNQEFGTLFHSESGHTPPKKVIVADDTLTADTAYKYACEGTGILWIGDYHNAKQLLQAMDRRIKRKPLQINLNPKEIFHLHRQFQAYRARVLNALLIPFESDFIIPLRRAPDVRAAFTEAQIFPSQDSTLIPKFVTSLREILGIIGAYEWQKKGVPIKALGNEHIHSCYGVFSPLRGEYIDLVAQAPLVTTELAFDIGTGTGVLAAVLAKRGVKKIIATDQDPRAIRCARQNIQRLNLGKTIEIQQTNLFPNQTAPLIICNPPWIPARPSSPIEGALYDYESKMLQAFLNGLDTKLTPNGEAWLIISDLAVHLGLRTEYELEELISTANLKIIDTLHTQPKHMKSFDKEDPLYEARSKEITTLYRLANRSKN